MAKENTDAKVDAGTQTPERHGQARTPEATWRTAITQIEPNRILVRGYPLDELMGRVSFGEAIYLLLMGELPSPAIRRLIEALLVSFIDHGVTSPSTLAALNVATTGASLRASVAAGVLGFGEYYGGDIESSMHLLESGLQRVRRGSPYHEVAEELVRPYRESGDRLPGFGHRFHTRDPRAARLFQMTHELEVDGANIQMIRAIEQALAAHAPPEQPALRVNIEGAIAAVCADLGFDATLGNALFIISRVPGLIVHAHEERVRQRPMRQVDPGCAVYDGPAEHRLPETRR